MQIGAMIGYYLMDFSNRANQICPSHSYRVGCLQSSPAISAQHQSRAGNHITQAFIGVLISRKTNYFKGTNGGDSHVDG